MPLPAVFGDVNNWGTDLNNYLLVGHDSSGHHSQWFNVKEYGAKGDGVSDDAAAFNSVIQAAVSAGGGVVLVPPGVYVVGSSIILNSKVHLWGSGIDATIIQLKASANVDVLLGANFASLTGTNNASAGILNWSLRDFTVDGNKANNTSGYGIRVYGAGFIWQNIIVRNCANDGIYSEFATSANEVPVGDSLDAHLSGVKSHDNLGHGIEWAGPHDSYWEGVDTFQNGNQDNHAGIYVRNSTTVEGTRLQIANSHSWGNSQSWALKTEGPVSTVNCQWEGAQLAQVLLGGSDASHTASDSVMDNDVIYASGSIANPVGIEVGIAAGAAPAGLQIRAKVINCTTAAVKYTNDGGLNRFDLVNYQTSGAVTSGTQNASTQLNIFNLNTGASQTVIKDHLLTKGSTPTLGALQAGVSSQSLSANANDTRGTLTIVTTASPPGASAPLALITFANAYPAIPAFFCQDLAAIGMFVSGTSVSGFTVNAAAALAASTTYFIEYFIIG